MNHGPQFGKHCSVNEEEKKKKRKNHQTGFQRLSSGPVSPSLLKLQGLLVIVKYEERAKSFLRSLPTLWYFFFSVHLIETLFPFHHTSCHYSSLVITILSFNSLQRISFSSLLVFQVPPLTPTCSILPTESLTEANSTPLTPGQCTNIALPSLTPSPLPQVTTQPFQPSMYFVESTVPTLLRAFLKTGSPF